MTLPRFRIRTLMIAVAVVAIAATFGRPYDETTAMLALILATDLVPMTLLWQSHDRRPRRKRRRWC